MPHQDPFQPSAAAVLAYRKAGMACVALAQGLPNTLADAILQERMDEHFAELAASRQILRQKHFDIYLSTLARECVVRYAATAAERMADDPEKALVPRRVLEETGFLAQTDDANVLSRLEQMTQPFFSVGMDEEESTLMAGVLHGLCAMYSSLAFRLVHGPLNSIILEAVEEILLGRQLDSDWFQERIESLPAVEIR